jgi:hypothetical protein
MITIITIFTLPTPCTSLLQKIKKIKNSINITQETTPEWKMKNYITHDTRQS